MCCTMGIYTQTDVTQPEVDEWMAVILETLAETIFCFSFAPMANVCVCQTPALHHGRIVVKWRKSVSHGHTAVSGSLMESMNYRNLRINWRIKIVNLNLHSCK